MDIKRLGIRIVGWLSLVVGYGLALLLIRGVFMGITGGFRADRSQAFWIVLGYLLFLALAVYLFTAGRRALSIAKGSPRPAARFGWGRIVVGTLLLYSYSARQFQLMPVRYVNSLEPTNETQAVTMKVTAVVMAVGCLALLLSGLWKGFRPKRAETQI